MDDSRVIITQDLSAKEIEHVFKRNKRRRVRLFTDDGNQIKGRIKKVHKGYVLLRHATVTKKGRVRLSNVSLRVAFSKIDSFHISHHR
jgi:16S rRNA U1498 N3-methylase RsmE